MVYQQQLRDFALPSSDTMEDKQQRECFLAAALARPRLLWARAAVLSRAFSVALGKGALRDSVARYTWKNV